MTNKKITSLMIKALQELKKRDFNVLQITWQEAQDKETASYGFMHIDPFNYARYGTIRLNNKKVLTLKETNHINEIKY